MRTRLVFAAVAGLLSLPLVGAVPAQAATSPSHGAVKDSKGVVKISRDFTCTVGSTFKNCSTTISVKPGESLLVSVNGDGDVTTGDFRARKAGTTLRQVADVSADDADSTLVWTNDGHASVSVQMQVKSSDKGTISGTFQTES